MRKRALAVFWLTRNILKVNFRKKATLITFFILPILGILISIGAYSHTGSAASRIGVLDRDQSSLSGDLTKALDGEFKVTRLHEKELDRAIIEGTIDCAVIIPRGFEAGVIYRQQIEKLQLISLKGEAGSVWLKRYLDILLQNMKDIGEGSGGDRKIFAQINHAYRQERIAIQAVNVGDQSRSKEMTTQSIGFLILFMLVGVGNSVEMILKEKRNRTYYRICAAPVSSRSYVSGNVLANLVIVMIQVLLALLVMTRVFRFNTYVPFWQLYMILVLFGLAAIGLGLLIVAVSRDTTQAGVLQNLIIVPTCFLAGCFWPAEIMPQGLRRMGDFLPQKWAMAAIQKLQDGAGLAQVGIHILIILAFALTFFLIAAYLFSRNEDMKGFV